MMVVNANGYGDEAQSDPDSSELETPSLYSGGVRAFTLRVADER
jgi:hypothetical protein